MSLGSTVISSPGSLNGGEKAKYDESGFKLVRGGLHDD